MTAIKTDYRRADLSAVNRALLDFAVKLTLEPSSVGRADIGNLRRKGLEDSTIHDAVQVVALFNYYNRLADGLGVDLEPDMPADSRFGDPEGC